MLGPAVCLESPDLKDPWSSFVQYWQGHYLNRASPFRKKPYSWTPFMVSVGLTVPCVCFWVSGLFISLLKLMLVSQFGKPFLCQRTLFSQPLMYKNVSWFRISKSSKGSKFPQDQYQQFVFCFVKSLSDLMALFGDIIAKYRDVRVQRFLWIQSFFLSTFRVFATLLYKSIGDL